MDTPFKRVLQAIRDQHPRLTGREQAWLATSLEIDVQTVNNWSRRGIPVARIRAIAALLGMTYDQVAGTEEVLPAAPAWPFDGFIERARWANARPEHRAAAAHAAMKVLDELESRNELIPANGKPRRSA